MASVEEKSTEFSGSLTLENFQAAICQLAEFAQSKGDTWTQESYQGITYLSHIVFKEIDTSSLLKWEYHVIYSLSYSVPVIYFNISFPSGKRLSVDELCLHLKKSINEVSQQEHPLLHIPFFCLHPCHTVEIMKILGKSTHKSALSYLVSWLSLVAQVLEFPFSNEYGKLLN